LPVRSASLLLTPAEALSKPREILVSATPAAGLTGMWGLAFIVPHLGKAQAAAARAEATVKFLTDELLAEAAPEKNPRQKQVTVEEVLKRAARKIDKAFAGQPGVEAAVQGTVGATYRLFGEYPEGEPHLRRALESLRSRRRFQELVRSIHSDRINRLGFVGSYGSIVKNRMLNCPKSAISTWRSPLASPK
jgi:hypothetical protein